MKQDTLLQIPGTKGKPINGVLIKKLTKIPDERGAIFHMLRADDDLFTQFGEIYFSQVYPNIIKAWHIHQKMTLNYAVVSGAIKLVLYDARTKSSTYGNILEIITGDDNYLLIQIPPLIWNGFKGVGIRPSLVANCASHPHEKNEIKRISPFSKKIPYIWDVKHE